MTDIPHKRFTFDTVFDDRGGMTAPLRVKKNFTLEEMEEAKAQAYADGEQSAVAQAEREASMALNTIGQAIHGAFSALAAVAHEHREGSAMLALACGRAIADAALDQFPEAPTQAALVALAREVEASPKLTVRVASHLVERTQTALETTAHAIGFPGQILARADANLPAAAFLLDWGDGRAAFDPTDAAARVTQALEAAIAAEGLHAEPLLPASES